MSKNDPFPGIPAEEVQSMIRKLSRAKHLIAEWDEKQDNVMLSERLGDLYLCLNELQNDCDAAIAAKTN